MLCYLEGQTHEEAARRLRCSAGSVRGRLDRARQKLKRPADPPRPGAGRGTGRAGRRLRGRIGGRSGSRSSPATVATLARAATATAILGSSSAALELADAVFQTMGAAKLRLAVLLIVGIVATGSLSLGLALEPIDPRHPAGPISPAARSPRAPVADDKDITVTGRVLDGDGQPLAGARVAQGSDLRGLKRIKEATSDAAGRFVLPGLPPGPTVLTVEAPGHAPDLMSLERWPRLAAGRIPARPGAYDSRPDRRRPRQADRRRADRRRRMARTPLAPLADPDRRRRAIPLGQCAGRPGHDRPGHARVQREAFLVSHARRGREDRSP